MTTVELLDATRKLTPRSVEWITEHVEKGMKHLGAVGEVRVRVVEDAEMAQAHEEFAGVAGTTDVLTFDLKDPEEGAPPAMDLKIGCLAKTSSLYSIDTDIMVCLDEAIRQSKGGGGGQGVEKELLLYVLHGILHCLGMDDHEEQSFNDMHQVEDAVLAAIGVGPVFARRRDPHTPESGA